MCLTSCIPDCEGKTCGDDGCSGNCGSCLTGQSCSDHQCVSPTCTPVCVISGNPLPCGFPDQCGGTCDTSIQKCPGGQFCKQGQCIPNANTACTANCAGKSCGDLNGCGGKCIVQTCDVGKICVFGACGMTNAVTT